jgi:uncharacterized protein (TIGR02271 family)
MHHTLIAVFERRSDAQQALDDLLASGYARGAARLSEGDPTGQSGLQQDPTTPAARDDSGFGSSIRHFFTDIFGTDRSPHAQMYADAVTRGHYVLTLVADNEPEVERAADIVERYGPVDIDEHAQQWGAADAPGGARAAGGAMQQAAGMAQQSAQQTMQGAGLQGGAASGSQQRADTRAIPVVQEELKVGKREVQRGGVRIYQRVVETPVTQTVGLREEHVNVERHPVDRPLSDADVNPFQETTIELREAAEEAVVEKTARVVEEVVVDKKVTQRQENIRDTVRRTEVEIEQLTPDDDAYFRGHWSSNYGNKSGAYEDYAPAYGYGGSMARSERYRGRPWEEVETSLRSDWESRHPGSAWDKMKAAVRHGWERVKG